MPPRIPISLPVRVLHSHTPFSSSIAPFLIPCLQFQSRSASILSSLSDNPGAYNRRIRRGRGPSSGKGKTSGRGHKGQKQHGKVPAGFNGGQTPLEVVHGVRGFVNKYVLSISHFIHTDHGYTIVLLDVLLTSMGKMQLRGRHASRKPQQNPILDRPKPSRPHPTDHYPRTRHLKLRLQHQRWCQTSRQRRRRITNAHPHRDLSSISFCGCSR